VRFLPRSGTPNQPTTTSNRVLLATLAEEILQIKPNHTKSLYRYLLDSDKIYANSCSDRLRKRRPLAVRLLPRSGTLYQSPSARNTSNQNKSNKYLYRYLLNLIRFVRFLPRSGTPNQTRKNLRNLNFEFLIFNFLILN
jgi:hypothetical protein